jgi:hypothetical protein
MSRTLLLLLLVPSLVPAAAPPAFSPTAHGDRQRDAYFRSQAKRLGEAALADIKTTADWDRKAPQMRQQFLDMMGLWPLPPRSNLCATITGTLDRPTFTVEKLHFQSMPGLYVTGNLYLPKKRPGPCPAVLYVCGHAPVVIDKVPYGNKVAYQHHGVWFAENGYVCLVVDTLQLGELPGLHHGTSRFNMWWWVSLGYTPAGIELWNAMRAIDYLETRKEVDRKRIGVTGRSGGGATSWWVGAGDERVKCIIPVAGIADLLAHVSEGYPGRLADGVVAGHCDCMYMVNTYRWDYTQVIALSAPRALLLGNSDDDAIFPVPGYRRMTGKIAGLYDILGARERFGLLETKGPHKDTPDLRRGAFRWTNRWLKEDPGPVTTPDRPRLDPQQLKVFARPPADAINDVVHERFRRAATIDLPESKEVIRGWWKGKAPELKKALLGRTFRGWPERPPALGARLSADVKQEGVRVRAFDFLSEEAVPLRVWLIQAEKVDSPIEVIARVVDETGWRERVASLGPAFQEALYGVGNPAPRPYPEWQKERFRQQRTTMERYGLAYAIIAPRGVGPTRWSGLSRFDHKPADHQIRRRFYLLGQTWEGQQIWDVRRALQCLEYMSDLKKAKWTLHGKGEAGVLALYAAIYEPTIGSVELWHPPTSHREGPTLLNVLTVLDVPQAVGLMLPRKVALHVKDAESTRAWNWPVRLQESLGETSIQVKVVGE